MSGHFPPDQYQAAREFAQREADADGMDRGIELMQLYRPKPSAHDYYRVFLLPRRHNRQGHETRCEVVMCSDLKRCQIGHGPEAPAHVPVEQRLAIARAHGRMLDFVHGKGRP